MFKIVLLAVLAIAGAQAQNAGNGESAAPEPYSYGYQTETHSAAEQRDPSGTVTGYYTLADADGRQRRVEYVADAAGFRAKVATNEVGTKSENSADVEVQAAPPTQEQLVQQAPSVQRVTSQQVVAAAPQRTGVAYVQQPAYGYSSYGYAGYPYANGGYRGYNGYNGYNGYTGYTGYNNGYGLASYPYGYGAYNGVAYGAYNGANNNGAYYTYNNHLPSQYYRSIGQGVGYGAQGASRYVVSSPSYSTGYQTVNVPASVGYQTVPAVSSRSVSSSSGLSGSSNYLVIQKRDAQAAAKETVAKSS